VAERVIELDLGVIWNAEAPWSTTLLIGSVGRTLLALPAADNQGWVVLTWYARGAVMHRAGPAGDVDPIAGHRLYRHGLDRVQWAGEVLDSDWVAAIEARERVTPNALPGARSAQSRHYVIVTKDSVVEVVASRIEILRIAARSGEEAALLGSGVRDSTGLQYNHGYWVLPVGDGVIDLAVGPRVELRIGSHLLLQPTALLTVRAGGEVKTCDPSDPQTLGPLVALRQALVIEALVHKSGQLRIVCDNGSVLTVDPDDEGEAFTVEGDFPAVHRKFALVSGPSGKVVAGVTTRT
jgi:hypothetical protein